MNYINQSINNSVQVNVLNLVEDNRVKQTLHRHNQYEKYFEPTLFELEHADTTDFTRGIKQLIFILENLFYL